MLNLLHNLSIFKGDILIRNILREDLLVFNNWLIIRHKIKEKELPDFEAGLLIDHVVERNRVIPFASVIDPVFFYTEIQF